MRKWFYYRFIHQPLMRLAHRHGWHHTHTIGPMEDGTVIFRCGWCGLQQVSKPLRIVSEDELLASLSAAYPKL